MEEAERSALVKVQQLTDKLAVLRGRIYDIAESERRQAIDLQLKARNCFPQDSETARGYRRAAGAHTNAFMQIRNVLGLKEESIYGTEMVGDK